MTPSPKDTQPGLDGQAAQATFRDFVQEQVRVAIRATFIDILEEEVSQFIGAGRYERTPTRLDRRAGHRTRTIGTTAGVIKDYSDLWYTAPDREGGAGWGDGTMR